MPYNRTHRHPGLTQHDLYVQITNVMKHMNCCLTKNDIKVVYSSDFILNVYVSESFVKLHPLCKETEKMFGKERYELYKILLRDGVLNYNNSKDPQNVLRKHFPNTIIEHTIPSDTYMSESNILRYIEDEDYFNKVCNVISLCLITKEEDLMLSKKVKSGMPLDENKEPVDFLKYPFARYDKTISGIDKNIELYSWKIKNGNIFKKDNI